MSKEMSGGGTRSSVEEMSKDESLSSVVISIGQNELRIEGTESFISNELSNILDRIDLSSQSQMDTKDAIDKAGSMDEEASENGASPSTRSEEDLEEEVDDSSPLKKVAERINVPYGALSEHFYLDEDEIHIQDPRNIEPKYALLGYCTIKEELHGKTYHENTETKKKLIDNEKVNIEDWGGTLLYNLREGGYIKDDPNSSKSRFKPFKITPSGREKLVDWLNEDD